MLNYDLTPARCVLPLYFNFLMIDHDIGQWNNLSRGSEALVQERGPIGFSSDFDRAMLESQRAFFMIQDLSAGRDCFLAEPQWRALFKAGKRSSDNSVPCISLRNQLCDFLVDLPGLTSNITAFVARVSAAPEQDYRAHALSLLSRVMSFKHDFELWYQVNIDVLHQSDSPFWSHPKPRDYPERIASGLTAHPHYQGVLSAVLYCISNSILIQLDKLIISVQQACKSGDGPYLFKVNKETYVQQQRRARRAFNFVKGRSNVASKPLAHGLRQFWSQDE
ncbi:uncharacterized protein Z518_08974 [Rhinocladiella mackenziei CBS 650.93]|uniref:Uncharacterized protein n=1 Tax=Rhinocladiella mackenziei CBS 650.93 TaxID=1442369 RepID=A0A0D2I613_9EURO|nr:uncharacterized protein Z518_08974 [Rhinocladiella mackenziei CBS 650.93]KIX01249.1 hypothetical protein Z518_08974 [Rhinocladiella mackenziei CBS 650.93]